MRRPHTLVMQVSKITHLFVADFGVEYATHIVNWKLYKPVARGELPQSASLHSKGNISCESRDQEQDQS